MLEQLLPFLTASILLTLSPGPDIIYVLVQGMTNGKKHGIVTALGLVTGIIIHTSLVAFGVSAVIRESPSLFFAIKVFGAIYLFYLAYKVYSGGDNIEIDSAGGNKKGLLSLYKRGLLMNVLNPKVAIFFLAFFPGFLWEPEANTLLQFYILGFLFMLQALLIFSLIAILSGQIFGYIKTHSGAGVIFKWVQVGVFLGIGIFILF